MVESKLPAAPITSNNTLGGRVAQDAQTGRRDHLIGNKANIISIVFVCLYFYYLWQPPIFQLPHLRWYIVIIWAVVAYLAHKTSLNLKAASVYWIVYGIAFLGACLSLLRAPQLEHALTNTVAAGVNFLYFLLFIPILANKTTRLMLLIILLGVSFLWVTEVISLLVNHSRLIYSTFAETGDNKNFIGFLFSLASTALLYLSLTVTSQRYSRLAIILTRGLLAALSVGFLFMTALIYARSSILAALVGWIAVMAVSFYKRAIKTSKILQIVSLSAFFMLSAVILLPRIVELSPQWQMIARNVEREGIDAFHSRQMLIRKGLFLVSENPILGVGIGGSRFPVESPRENFPGFLIHNSYLSDWAERGLLGLLSNIMLVCFYIQIFRKKFIYLSSVDQIWMLLIFQLFFSMMFIDMNTTTMMMVSILAGINHVKRSGK
ncbi:MAG: O-antigen ligase family protein [Anaerolineaceae bacterium]|jgi:O-antigen ligase